MRTVFGVMLALGLLLLLIARSCSPTPADEKAALARKQAALAIAAANPPAPRTTTRIVERVGKERKLYKFVDGCAEMRLTSDVSFYPKGGWVTITPPHPGKPWDDAPGILNKEEGVQKPAGWYRVCKKNSSSDAWGIEIWN